MHQGLEGMHTKELLTLLECVIGFQATLGQHDNTGDFVSNLLRRIQRVKNICHRKVELVVETWEVCLVDQPHTF